MIYFLYGSDKEKSRAKANSIILDLQKKNPDASLFRIADEDFSTSKIEELVSSQGLFHAGYIVLLDNLFVRSESREFLEKILARMSESPHVFVVLEGVLKKEAVETIKKHSEQFQKFDSRGGAAFNDGKNFIFSLSDFLGRRDRRKLWVGFQKAIAKSVSAEEMTGTFFWQLKSILAAKRSDNAARAGLNPFVFQKSKRYGANFTEDDVRVCAWELVSIYHNAHRGLVDFETALENFILRV